MPLLQIQASPDGVQIWEKSSPFPLRKSPALLELARAAPSFFLALPPGNVHLFHQLPLPWPISALLFLPPNHVSILDTALALQGSLTYPSPFKASSWHPVWELTCPLEEGPGDEVAGVGMESLGKRKCGRGLVQSRSWGENVLEGYSQ